MKIDELLKNKREKIILKEAIPLWEMIPNACGIF